MKTALSLFLVVTCVVFAGGCDFSGTDQGADASQAAATRASMEQAQREVGMPAIKNWQERKWAKMIFELRDQSKLTTYAYIVNRMTGKLVFFGECIGYGLPYSTQYTNPERIAHNQSSNGGSFGTMPQPDPNGLFTPTGLSATWLMMVDDKGEVRPVYVEPEIIVSPFPLHEQTTE